MSHPPATPLAALSRRAFGLGLLGCGLGLPMARAARASSPEPTPRPATYPAIGRSAATPQGFVPTGWAIEREQAVDLDGDGTPDVVVVLREHDPGHLLQPFGPEGRTLDTNPRLLLVAFADRKGGPYRLVLSNHTLIPRHETITVEDPFGQESQGLEAGPRSFSVWLHRFASAGGRDMGNTRLTFRFAGERCELIGFERQSVDRFSGRTLTLSANYLTGRLKREFGTIRDDRTRIAWSKLRDARRPTLEEVGDGLAFSPASA